jgi:hypothetical protein
MASDGNAFEILPDPQLEDFTAPAVSTFLETHHRYERTIDDKNVPLSPSSRIPKTPLKTAITSHVLAGITSRYHVKVSKDDLTDEALLEGCAKTSLKRDDYNLTFRGAKVEYQMTLKPFDRVKNLALQCENMIHSYGLQQIVETKAGNNK